MEWILIILFFLAVAAIGNTYYWYRKTRKLYKDAIRDGIIDCSWEDFLDKNYEGKNDV